MFDLHRIRMLVFDVDGVLTDGTLTFDANGVESKTFHVRDGHAIKVAAHCGMKLGIITGRASRCVSLRAAELGIDLVLQGVRDKAIGLETLCQRAQLEPDAVACMGDDLPDLPMLLRCGYSMTVADAAAEVLEIADFVTNARGGHGAVRQAIEHVLKAQGKWVRAIEM